MPTRPVPAAAALTLLLSGLAAPAAQALPGAGEHPGREKARDALHFTVRHTGDTTKDGRYTLACDPPRGSHPEPREACAALEKASTDDRNPFEPVAPDTPCTMISGGPATAHVVGTWHGERIDTRFDRKNGCEIHRWDALTPALPHT